MWGGIGSVTGVAALIQMGRVYSVSDVAKAGLRRTVELHGTRLGRPPISEIKLEKARSALMAGKGIRETARLTKVSPAKVTKVRKAMTVTGVAI